MGVISVLGDIIGVVASSQYLLWGVIAVVVSFGLSMLAGLIEVARYIVFIGGVGLIVYGVVAVLFPEVVPLMLAF